MKRATRRLLIEEAQFATELGKAAGDAVDSDARQRAKIRDLRARLAEAQRVRQYDIKVGSQLFVGDGLAPVFDLKNKNWRKP